MDIPAFRVKHYSDNFSETQTTIIFPNDILKFSDFIRKDSRDKNVSNEQ